MARGVQSFASTRVNAAPSMDFRISHVQLLLTVVVTTLAAGFLVFLSIRTRRRRSAAAITRTFLELNDGFRTAYEAMRAADAAAAPVLVLLADSLVLFRGGERKEQCATPPAVRAIKSIAHFPVGIFVALEGARFRSGADDLDAVVVQKLTAMREVARAADRLIGRLDAHLRLDTETVLARSRRFVESVLAKRTATEAELSTFAGEMGPLLLRLTEHATRLQLKTLDGAVQKLLANLSASERDRLEVVVAGAHQARVRSLGLQYFQKRFGEAPGEEVRVTYAESAADAEEARALVGTRRLDRTIARAFFGDEKRLQRDVLGDIASALLAEADVARSSQAPAA